MKDQERRLVQWFPISCHHCFFSLCLGCYLKPLKWRDTVCDDWFVPRPNRNGCLHSYLKRLSITVSQAANPTLVICLSQEIRKKQSNADLL